MKGVRTIKNEQEKEEEEDWKLMYGCNDQGNLVILLCCLRHLSLSTKVKFNLSTEVKFNLSTGLYWHLPLSFY